MTAPLRYRAAAQLIVSSFTLVPTRSRGTRPGCLARGQARQGKDLYRFVSLRRSPRRFPSRQVRWAHVRALTNETARVTLWPIRKTPDFPNGKNPRGVRGPTAPLPAYGFATRLLD